MFSSCKNTNSVHVGDNSESIGRDACLCACAVTIPSSWRPCIRHVEHSRVGQARCSNKTIFVLDLLRVRGQHHTVLLRCEITYGSIIQELFQSTGKSRQQAGSVELDIHKSDILNSIYFKEYAPGLGRGGQ